ncbi:zinc-binding dehydrogenase [Streptomyces nigra]|uniref:zinc-binding dehydrogenase n=1 Tax=Streptomyces nigra TaxID=1827580 RepID=UPI003633B6BE
MDSKASGCRVIVPFGEVCPYNPFPINSGSRSILTFTPRGGTVIGIVSGAQKADTARQAGADHIVISTGAAFVEPVLDLTDGEGVDVVFDGGGETTFRASMSVLRRHGLLLYYGAVLGAAPVVNMRELPRSIKISYPVFRDHIPTREALLRHSADLFDLVRNKNLDPGIGHRYPLDAAAQAHRDIESRATTGKLLLLP